jgi:DNA-binding transcriptional LysR family regulator
MDRFASITAFVRVAESGGFSAAGRRLNLSKDMARRRLRRALRVPTS